MLRRIVATDLPELYAGFGDPQVTHHYGVHFDSLDATREQLAWYDRLLAEGTGIWWAVCDRRTATFLGAIGLNDLKAVHRKAEIGFWLLRAHWGKGIMSDVLPHVLRHAFGDMGLHRVEAIVETDNRASGRLLARHGFSHEGTMREAERKHGRWIDLEIHALLAGTAPR